MSTFLKKGVTVWIFGFLTIVAFVNVFNSVLMWTLNGNDFLFNPYFIDQFIGQIQVNQYFWISMIVGFILLGCTAFTLNFNDSGILNVLDTQKKTQLDSKIMLAQLDSKIENEFEAQKRVQTNSWEAYRTILKSQENMETNINNMTSKSQENLKMHIDNVSSELSKTFSKQEAFVKKLGGLVKEVEDVKKDIVNVKNVVQSLENELLYPHSEITAESSTIDIDGIGPIITKELAAVGITNAGEFLLADPEAISDCTHLSRDQAQYLQDKTQLLMIPGIDKAKIELFEKIGVANRKELAAQDPFDFNIKLLKAYNGNEKYSNYKKPTFEDVLSWIRTAKM